ncbi:MAG: MBL fold metallo-hydrolase [Spirochaetia bacterium]|nr:MBL fold metallo-hydrolase [Spirochaetia bacterium]
METEQSRVLFDVGYSDAFLRNAHTLGIDLLSIDTLVLSHGHIDHTGGLDVLLKEYMEARFERRLDKVPRLVAHPDAFLPKFLESCSPDSPGISIGSTLGRELLSRSFHLHSSREPLWLDDRLVFLRRNRAYHGVRTSWSHRLSDNRK